MDATQFVGIVEPCRAPDHSHSYDELGYIVEGDRFCPHRQRVDPAPGGILLPPAARAGALHREHRPGRDADPRRLPPVRRSRFKGIRGQLGTDSGVLELCNRQEGMECTEGNGRELPRSRCSSSRRWRSSPRRSLGPMPARPRQPPPTRAATARRSASRGRSPVMRPSSARSSSASRSTRSRSWAAGKIKLSQQDTQLDAAQASTTGTKLHADANVLAVVGPAGSQEVLAVAPIYKKDAAPAVHLRLGDPHVADERLDPELLPGRPERQRPGAVDGEVHPSGAEGQ